MFHRLSLFFQQKAIITLILLLIFFTGFFSYRLLDVPTGLSSDEASFAYNAALLSETMRDQNNRFMPIFVLASDHHDWRQPVTQYYLTAFFKLFGANPFNLRFSSILITITSAVLIFILTRQLINTQAALFATILFLTTPLIMIQSHLALDNIMPVPFTILWLLFIYNFKLSGKRKNLILAALSLGVAFYSYKGMRATVPVWCILTVLYLFSDYFPNKTLKLKEVIKNAAIFSIGILPFFLVIPLLELKYAGAVFDRQGANFTNLYEFLYPYFSSFDFSYLFITGDATPFHSTGRHGMMLLATLPLFIIGLYQAYKKRGFWIFILLSFLTAPALYGFVNSIHRASRLMSMIPPYVLLITLGGLAFYHSLKKYSYGKALMVVFAILIFINYADFVNYYWFEYAKTTFSFWGDMSGWSSYQTLAKESNRLNLKPVISDQVKDGEGDKGLFFAAANFPPSEIKYVSQSKDVPSGSLFMTVQDNITGMKRLNVSFPISYKLQIK